MVSSMRIVTAACGGKTGTSLSENRDLSFYYTLRFYKEMLLLQLIMSQMVVHVKYPHGS